VSIITVSIAYVAWLLGHDPTRRVVVVSYSDERPNSTAVPHGHRCALVPRPVSGDAAGAPKGRRKVLQRRVNL